MYLRMVAGAFECRTTLAQARDEFRNPLNHFGEKGSADSSDFRCKWIEKDQVEAAEDVTDEIVKCPAKRCSRPVIGLDPVEHRCCRGQSAQRFRYLAQVELGDFNVPYRAIRNRSTLCTNLYRRTVNVKKPGVIDLRKVVIFRSKPEDRNRRG